MQLIPDFPRPGKRAHSVNRPKLPRAEFLRLNSQKLHSGVPGLLSALYRENNNNNTNKISNLRRPEKARENAAAATALPTH